MCFDLNNYGVADNLCELPVMPASVQSHVTTFYLTTSLLVAETSENNFNLIINRLFLVKSRFVLISK